MGKVIEEIKNFLGQIFEVVGVGVFLIGVFLMIYFEDIVYLSLITGGATFLGLGLTINQIAYTAEKKTVEYFKKRKLVASIWNFFEPRSLIDGKYTYFMTDYNDKKTYYSIAEDARNFLNSNVKDLVKDAFEEMEIVLDKSNNKLVITFNKE